MLALALFMRLVRIDLAQFDIDQAKLLDPAVHFLRTGQLPLAGGTTFSVGINIPPLITYLLALPLVFTHDAVWLAASQAALDAVGAVFVYFAVRQFAGSFAAFAAGAFYAVLPDAILNSRALTNGSAAPFLCAVCLWGLVAFVKSGNAGRLGIAALAFGLAIELHVTVAVFAPVLILAAALRWRDLRWQPLASAAGVLALSLAPYLYLQLGTGFGDVRSLGGFAGGVKQLDMTALEVAAGIAAGSVQDHFTLAPLDAVGWLVLAIVLAGLLVAFWRHRPIGLILALWLALPILATIRHSGSLATHYYFGIFPAVAILGGLGIAGIPVRLLSVALLAVFVPLRAGQWLLFQQDLAAGNPPSDHSVTRRYVGNGYVPSRYVGPYGIPLRFELQAADTALQARATPVYLGPREGSDMAFRFLSDGHLPVVGLSGRQTSLLPMDGSLLMLDGRGAGLEWPLQRFSSQVGAINSDSGRPFYTFFRLEQGWLDRFNASLPLQPLDVTFSAGLRLTGLSLSPLTTGQPAKLLLEWQPRQQPGKEVHRRRLLDAAAKPRSSDPDADVFAGTEWSAGASVLSESQLTPDKDIPTGGYWLELGLYDPLTGARLPMDGGGTELRLGPMKVRGRTQPVSGASPRAVFGAGEIELDDVQLNGESVVLGWRALSRPHAAYTVFVHALDAAGQVTAQHDGPPVAGSYPTSLWDAGDVVRDAHPLSGSLAGVAKLEIGLYTQPDLRRLPVVYPPRTPEGSPIEMPQP
ncbi:MAG: ArnT family glycosyltransferase [Chloroflexota bacterium]